MKSKNPPVGDLKSFQKTEMLWSVFVGFFTTPHSASQRSYRQGVSIRKIILNIAQ